MREFRQRTVVNNAAIRGRILHENPTETGHWPLTTDHFLRIVYGDFDAEPFGAGFYDGDGLRVDVVSDEEFGAVFVEAVAHVHGFGGGGGFVEHAGVGHGKAGEVGDHGLEIQPRFEAALGDFGLVGGVLGVPAGAFENIAEDDGRRDGAVVAHADEGFEDFVFVG